MRPLRKFLRFWFGLNALCLVAGMFTLFVSVAKGEVASAHPIVTVLLLVVLDVFPAIAWWTLKKGMPSGQIWALISCAFSMTPAFLKFIQSGFDVTPIGMVGAVLGFVGLIAFWSKDSAADAADTAKTRKIRVAGDGTSDFKDYVAQGISISVIWMAYRGWNQWAAFHELSSPGPIAYFAQFAIGILLTTLFHELGHLIAGWASGKMLRLFQVGPFRWVVRNGRWRFYFQWRKFSGGGVAMIAPDLRDMRSRKAFALMGGPVASLVAGSIFTVATLTAVGHAWQPFWSLLCTLATFSLANCVVNLIPLKPESHYSDGAQLYQIVTNGPWARVHRAFAMVTTSAVSLVRPRDFDVDVINRAADFVPRGERGLLLRLFACIHYLDANRIPEAIDSMQEAEALFEQSVFEKPQDICAEFVFVNAFYKHDLAAAELWWQRIDALRNVDADADYWRAQTALHWLRGEREQAREAWERGNALAVELPAAGTYDFTRSCFAKLRDALDAPAQTGAFMELTAVGV